MTHFLRACTLTLSLGLLACASVPVASNERDAAAKSFQPPPPDRAYIYVYRNQSIPMGISTNIYLDLRPAGTITKWTFALLPVRPGHHTLVAEGATLPLSLEPPGKDAVQPIDVRGGEMVFVWLELQNGPAVALHVVPPDEGREWVSQCSLIATPPPPLPPAPTEPAGPQAPLPVPVSGSQPPPAVRQ